MKRTLFILLTGMFFSLVKHPASAQECRMYFPDNVGAIREMKSYDTKNKLTSVSKQEIIEKLESGNDVTIKVRSSIYTPDEKEVSAMDIDIECEDGVFKFDMKNFIDPNTMEAYKEMSIEMSGDQLAYPSRLTPGENLKDGVFKMVVKNNQITLLTLTTNVTNRKVEAIESITTEAGTFDCYKISYQVTAKAGFITTNATAIEWIAEGVGIVRSESFDRRGKSTGYTVLSRLKL